MMMKMTKLCFATVCTARFLLDVRSPYSNIVCWTRPTYYIVVQLNGRYRSCSYDNALHSIKMTTLKRLREKNRRKRREREEKMKEKSSSMGQPCGSAWRTGQMKHNRKKIQAANLTKRRKNGENHQTFFLPSSSCVIFFI